MDQAKYRRLFVDEARENLSTYANELVQFEKLTENGQSAAGVAHLDAVFRAAHSVKGMAASLGFEAIVALAHGLEDLADVGRARQRLSKQALDVLLEGGERLQAMVDAVERGEDQALDASDLPARARARIAEERGEPSVVPVPTSPAATTTEVAGPPPAPDEATVVVEVDADAPLPHVRAFMVHRALSTLPGYVRTEPQPEQIRQGVLPDHVVRFVFAKGTELAAVVERARKEQAVKDARIEAREAPERAAADATPEKREADRTVRVRTALLDEFIDSVGELLLARSRLRVIATRTAAPELDDLVGEIDRLTRDLHDRVIAARMTPLSFLTERFPPLVRSLARKLDKRVAFSIEGADIELDRAILDELGTPLIHMLRNAVDHAHEGEAARAASGKPVEMALRFRASRDRDTVLIELRDDGRGIDPARVRARAVERGIVDAARAGAMSDAEAIELICAPGFTTAVAVSETSGRGVGMDVVKATLEKLGGSLRIRSETGKGTTFTLRLPLTVAIIQVLVVETTGRDAFAIPVNRVERALDLDPSQLRVANGATHVLLGDDLLPLFDLAKELGFAPEDATRRATTAIVVGEDADRVAFAVGAVMGQEEVVVKPLGAPLSGFDFLAGGALLADGRAAYILEPGRLPRAPQARA